MLLKERALEMTTKCGRVEAQSWPWGSEKNNIIGNCITVQIIPTTCLILENVVFSVIRIGFNL